MTRIVGLGGTFRASSSSELALTTALAHAERHGCEVDALLGPALEMPFYNPTAADRTENARRLLEALRGADGVLIATPAYHGSVSGLLKNALDYIEDMAQDDRPYLDGLPVGCIGVGYGYQGAVNCIRSLRDIVHSLRGYPTPYAAAVNSLEVTFDENGASDPNVTAALNRVADQVIASAGHRRLISEGGA